MLTMLRTLRQQRKLTQSEVANALHISQTSISKMEHGLSEPDLALLLSMSDYFGVTVDEFLRGQINFSQSSVSGSNSVGESSGK